MAILAECPKCHRKQKVSNKTCDCGESLDKAKRSRRVKYWVTYRMPDGKQRREAVGFSVEEARTAEGKRKTQRYENPRILQKVPEERMTFQELTNWYLALEKVKGLRSFSTVQINLANFNKEFGNRVVASIKPADLENYQAQRKAAGYADASVDHVIGAARTVIIKAFDNDLVSGETVRTFKRVKKLLRPNSNARDRILTMDEFNQLMEHAPRHTKAVLVSGFYTGMRLGEVLSLEWSRVDLEKRLIRLEAASTKDKEARTIPICSELLSVLKAIPRALHDNHVFLFDGSPLKNIYGGLKNACAAAGIEYGRFKEGGFVYHDLRHCFNTYMRKAGVPESVIMQVTGHSTRSMFDRYNSIDVDDAHRAVDQLERFLQSVDHSVDQGTI